MKSVPFSLSLDPPSSDTGSSVPSTPSAVTGLFPFPTRIEIVSTDTTVLTTTQSQQTDISQQLFVGSTILSSLRMEQRLNRFYGVAIDQKWTLIYKASVHDWPQRELRHQFVCYPRTVALLQSSADLAVIGSFTRGPMSLYDLASKAATLVKWVIARNVNVSSDHPNQESTIKFDTHGETVVFWIRSSDESKPITEIGRCPFNNNFANHLHLGQLSELFKERNNSELGEFEFEIYTTADD